MTANSGKYQHIAQLLAKGERREVRWSKIEPDPAQPREFFDQAELANLARSMALMGQLQEIVVSPLPPGGKFDYQLIDGQRRWHAVQTAKIKTLRVIVVSPRDAHERFLISVVSNFARQGHTPMEIARACCKLKEGGMSVTEVADALGKSEPFVYQYLRLLDLIPEIQGRLHPLTKKAERVPVAGAMHFAKLTHERQRELFRELDHAGQLTLGQIRRRVEAMLSESPEARGPNSRVRTLQPNDYHRLIMRLLKTTQEKALDLTHTLSQAAFMHRVCTCKGAEGTRELKRTGESSLAALQKLVAALE
jgi:ParB/RepB/Spo0J family partition protein